jgi:hypothetical protein
MLWPSKEFVGERALPRVVLRLMREDKEHEDVRASASSEGDEAERSAAAAWRHEPRLTGCISRPVQGIYATVRSHSSWPSLPAEHGSLWSRGPHLLDPRALCGRRRFALQVPTHHECNMRPESHISKGHCLGGLDRRSLRGRKVDALLLLMSSMGVAAESLGISASRANADERGDVARYRPAGDGRRSRRSREMLPYRQRNAPLMQPRCGRWTRHLESRVRPPAQRVTLAP